MVIKRQNHNYNLVNFAKFTSYGDVHVMNSHEMFHIFQVTYDANGFLERNRDNLNQDLVACLLNSNNDFIKDLFTASKSDTGTISE